MSIEGGTFLRGMQSSSKAPGLARPAALILLLALSAGVAIAALLPPRALPASREAFRVQFPTTPGAFHVHTRRSDGTGTPDEIAIAAQAAGLQFVIFTDHGDGTKPPDPPTYRSGVLCVDGVEISTTGGHYVALGLSAAPYRLAGTPEAVIEDVHRLGGFGVAAHPESAKPELRWIDWEAGIDGVEWLNADSEWRDELWASLGRGLLTYTLRPVETLTALLDRPHAVLDRWDHLTAGRRIVGLAGADAHARLGYRQAIDPYEDRVLARVPGYESSFRAFRNLAVLDRPLEGNAGVDAATVLRAIREGRVYTVVTGLAGEGPFEFAGVSGRNQARAGEYLDLDGPTVLEARVAAPPGARLYLLRDGQPVYETAEGQLRIDVGTTPGAYRLEARLTHGAGSDPVPWLVSNPIYVGLRDAHRAAAAPRPRSAVKERLPVATSRWRAEVSAGSTSTIELGSPGDGRPAAAWHYALSPAAAPYAAVQFPTDGGLAGFDRLLLTMRADRPMRLWVQLRVPATGERWGRTFYADDTLREIVLPVDTFRPLAAPASPALPLGDVDSLLLVADTLNGKAGDRGTLHLRELWIAR
jgi:hypothetical protein